MSHHIEPTKTYVTVFVSLIGLTLLTTAVSFVDLGPLNTVAALVMNNLYQRQRVQRESASPYGHTAAANYLRRKPN